jgi:hypothetical protein
MAKSLKGRQGVISFAALLPLIQTIPLRSDSKSNPDNEPEGVQYALSLAQRAHDSS